MTPLVLGVVVLDALPLGEVTLGAPRSDAPASMTSTKEDPSFEIDIGPKLDDPIELPFERERASPAVETEDAPEEACDPIQAIRDSFRPRHLRCRPALPPLS
ncbi:MAG: hypothetical protein AAFZ18_13090 [Myxococcota bacterium]